MTLEKINELVESKKIEIINEQTFKFTCQDCGTTVSKSYRKLRDSGNIEFLQLCRKCKIHKTSLKHWGTSSPQLSEKVQEKVKQTNLQRYGTEYPLQSKDVREKMKRTNIERYGVENPLQSTAVQEKRKKLYREKYGYEHQSQNPKVKRKKEQTFLKHFGTKYGFSSEEVKEKIKRTNLKKYGVENYSQTLESKKYRKSNIFFNGFHFDSTWELAYYIYCVDHNIEIEVFPISIPYSYLNCKYYYQPDFLINKKQLVEIKGPQFFDENQNLINPYDRSVHSDGKNKAKQECMKRNNVQIISLNEIHPYLEHVNTKYGSDFLKEQEIRH